MEQVAIMTLSTTPAAAAAAAAARALSVGSFNHLLIFEAALFIPAG
jgi:hypothetical protein